MAAASLARMKIQSVDELIPEWVPDWHMRQHGKGYKHPDGFSTREEHAMKMAQELIASDAELAKLEKETARETALRAR